MNKFWLAIISVCLVAFASALGLDRLWISSIENSVEPEELIEIVLKSLGQPERIVGPGKEIEPGHVSGWIPPKPDNEDVYVFYKYRVIVYVYVDRNTKTVTRSFVKSP